jgi:hypothetical protein
VNPSASTKLKPGAYLLEANAGGKRARELILVTDATLVLKTSGQQALVYFCNALDGSPLATGKVKLWERWHADGKWHTREQSKEAGADGLAVFELARANHSNSSPAPSRRIARRSVPATVIGIATSRRPGRFTRLPTGQRIGPRKP